MTVTQLKINTVLSETLQIITVPATLTELMATLQSKYCGMPETSAIKENMKCDIYRFVDNLKQCGCIDDCSFTRDLPEFIINHLTFHEKTFKSEIDRIIR